jgi:glycosyltransferase involved in cell wall biosynthesis
MMKAVRTSSLSPILKLAGPASSVIHQALTSEAGGQVRYLGVLPPNKVPKVIHDSLAGLVILEPLPNYLDSQPTKLFEYMAAARPFIASNFASWRLLLDDYDCGIFVDPANVDDLSSAIEWVISEPELAREMGARGREAMVRHFTFENERAGLITMTRSLVTP